MGEVSIAVSLKAPDPAAVTALAAMKRMDPSGAPGVLERYEYWTFRGPGVSRDAVTEMISHYTDIVNPNKQIWIFAGDLLAGKKNDGRTWVPVLVSDRVDSVSETWTAILSGRRRRLETVRYSVLWLMGFDGGIPEDAAVAMAMGLAVTERRDRGLLANPVSQEVEILGSM